MRSVLHCRDLLALSQDAEQKPAPFPAQSVSMPKASQRQGCFATLLRGMLG